MYKHILFLSLIIIAFAACSKKQEQSNFKVQKLNEARQNQVQDLEEDSSEELEYEMTLQDKLDAFAEVSKARLSSDVKKIMIEALQRLKAKNLEAKFFKVGRKAPNFELKNLAGKEIELYDVLKKQAVVLLFYRGSWCPYCNLELKEYIDYYPRFKQAGIEILAISPEQQNFTRNFQNRNTFPFPLLFDKGNKVAKKYNLKFALDEELIPLYRKLGLDIGIRNGDDDWEIPVPATIIIGTDKKIYYNFADVDYKYRAEPDSVLEIAKATLL